MLPMINSKAEHTRTGEAMKEKDTQSTFLSEVIGELYKTKCFLDVLSLYYTMQKLHNDAEHLQCASPKWICSKYKITPDFEDLV